MQSDYFLGLQRFLVQMHYHPEEISHEVSHYVEHLVQLLPAADAEALLHYHGVLGHEQLSLADLARQHGLQQEDMMARIDRNLRRLAVSPEWQVIRSKINRTDV